MKTLKQISVLLLFLLISIATGYAQSNQEEEEEEITTKIENLYKNTTCSNHKKWLEEQGFTYDHMLKIEQTNAYIYNVEDEDISVFLYCYKNEAVHMSFNLPEEDFNEAKNITIKNREFKKIGQTSNDVTFIKGAYTFIFSTKDHSIGIRVRTRGDN